MPDSPDKGSLRPTEIDRQNKEAANQFVSEVSKAMSHFVGIDMPSFSYLPPEFDPHEDVKYRITRIEGNRAVRLTLANKITQEAKESSEHDSDEIVIIDYTPEKDPVVSARMRVAPISQFEVGADLHDRRSNGPWEIPMDDIYRFDEPGKKRMSKALGDVSSQVQLIDKAITQEIMRLLLLKKGFL